MPLGADQNSLRAYKLTIAGAQVISGPQIRAARSLLGLSSRELATLSGVSWATIKRFEADESIPPSRGGTLERLLTKFEDAGIEFLGDPVSSPGVRLKRQ
ncbi:helix-turn-helix domain-containing protein [Qipengyuania gaetbuli]|nr:helix-turn-helix domain-containing protein [Qipengyuania gaetbuli]